MAAAAVFAPGLESMDALRRLSLSPFLTGPVLLGLAYAPEFTHDLISKVVTRLPELITTRLPNETTGHTILRVLFAIGLLRTINEALTSISANAWRLTRPSGWDDWSSEIAVVTGGSSGIGAIITQRLTAMGVRVAILDIQPPKATPPGTKFYQCDVSSAASVADAAGKVRKEMGHPSILVNNAGITKPVPILRMDETFLKRIFGVNAMALWFTTQQFLPRMIQLDKGHVVTVASLASFVALPSAADYSATKAAAHVFHEALSAELKSHYKAPGVLTTVVHPSFVKTPLLDDFSEKLQHEGGVRMITPEDVADAVVGQIRKRRGAQVIVPRHAKFVSTLRSWPAWIQEIIRDGLAKAAKDVL